MKRILCIFVCLILVFSPVLSGCGSSSSRDPSEEISEPGSVAADLPDETVSASDKSEEPAPSPGLLPHETAEDAGEVEVPDPDSSKDPDDHPEPPPSPLRLSTEALLDSFGGEWSVYFERTDTGESFTIRNTPMVSASLIKLFVYGAVMEQIENGVLPDGYYDDALWNMISYSDNDACNYLIDEAGGFEAVNDFIIRNGYSSTQLNRKMLDFNGLENYTSAADCGALIRQALQGTFVSEHASALLLEMMESQATTWKIPAGVPEGIVTGNKTGELTGVENDAAFVYSPECLYILCVMSSGIDSGTAVAEINALSSHIYTLLNQDSEGEET